jgi:hypothetical protein
MATNFEPRIYTLKRSGISVQVIEFDSCPLEGREGGIHALQHSSFSGPRKIFGLLEINETEDRSRI